MGRALRMAAALAISVAGCRGWFPTDGGSLGEVSQTTPGDDSDAPGSAPDGDEPGGTAAGSSTSEVWDTEPIEVPCFPSAADCVATTDYWRDLGAGLEPIAVFTTVFDGCGLALEYHIDDDLDGLPETTQTWTRNAANQPVEVVGTLADGALFEHTTYAYDPVGHLVRTDTYLVDLDLLSWSEHTWVDGLRVRLVRSVADGHVEFEHDADGNEILWREIDGFGDEDKRIHYHWLDDGGMPRLERAESDYGADGTIDLVTGYVWLDGLEIERWTDSDADGDPDSTWRTEHDVWGREIEQRSFDEDGVLASESLTRWDCPT